MTEISIPDNEMNEFDLPRVDIVTGSTDGVVFKPVKFQLLTRRTEGELPFTEGSYATWRRGRLVLTLSIVAAFFLLAGGAILLNDSGVLGAVLILTAIAAPIAVGLTMVRGKGPRVVRIDKGFTVLRVPSAEAASILQAHLTSGGPSPQ